MKKWIALVMCLCLMLAFAGCTGGGNYQYYVGICQLVSHDALDAATQGFIDELERQFGKGVVKVDVQNAANDSATCGNIVNAFVSKNYDLIMANATPALQSAVAATTTIPILGTSVTDYGEALGIENFSGVTGTNVSGTSDLVPLDEQAAMILEWYPDAQKVGLLFCSGEPNSRFQVDAVRAYLEARNITVTDYSFTDSNDLPAVTQRAADNSDVIYVPTDNTVASSTGIIHSICSAKQVPIIAGEENTCKGCGVAALSINYYDLGVATGKMAAKILRGEANVAEMAIERLPATKKYNAEICQALGKTPLAGYVAIED